jgi:large subunit ribosomal protein L21
MYAVISDRGRQTVVREGEIVLCDWNAGWTAGQAISFREVHLISREGETRVGTPTLPGASVTGEVLGTVQGPKLVAFRFRRRKNLRRKRGHRQDYTQVRITGIKG